VKTFILYGDEIPYSTEVVIESFQETQTNAGEPLARIQANIYVMRDSQKAIILGKGGSAIKKLGTMARVEIEDSWQSQSVSLKPQSRCATTGATTSVRWQYFGY
jgi:GTP-binding protein Era